MLFSLNLLFGGVLVSVAVVVYFSALLRLVSSLIAVMTTSEERSVTILLGKVEIIYRNDPLGTADIFV